MKPAPFEYARPETLDEALELLAERAPDAKVLAGGQSLVPALNMRLVRPAVLVDINRVVELANVSETDNALRVGALVRQADRRLLEHPLLARCIPFIGHFVTRNRGTVCGSVAHADAAAELPVALVALGGTVVLASRRGRREVPAEAFFGGYYTTAAEPDELVVETVWPLPAGACAFEEFAQRRGDYGLAMAAAVASNGSVRVAVGSVTDRPTLLDLDPENPGESAAAQVEPFGNLHASAEYLRELTRVLVERAVAGARGGAG